MTTQDNQQVLARLDEPVNARLAPFTPLAVTATSSGTAQTFATVADRKAMLVKRLVAVNSNGSATALTLHAVPSGGSIAAGNLALSAQSVAANSAVDLTDLIAGLYAAGTTLQVFASATGVTISGHYEDLF